MMAQDWFAGATHRVSENAFDFLKRSVEEIEKYPKYSLIHFAAAIELLLKARLMCEHWSLVVDRISQASREAFLSGKCKTVGLDEAIRRLKKICNQSIPEEAADQFIQLAAHRNRLVHFFHEAGVKGAKPDLVEEIVKEQCNCWFYMDRLLDTWKDEFVRFDQEIAQMRWRMKANRSFLAVAFERFKPELAKDRNAGTVLRPCRSCGYEASRVHKLSNLLFTASCLVCSLSDTFVEVSCPAKCGATIQIASDLDSNRACEQCGHDVTASELYEIMDTDRSYRSINCAFCSSNESVVPHGSTYVCTKCVSCGDVAECEWCNELQLGDDDLEFSGMTGCEFCDGHPEMSRFDDE